MFDLRTEFYNWCRYPSLSAQPENIFVRPDYELMIRLFSAAAVLPENPALNDFDFPLFTGMRRFGNEGWAERRAVSQDSCGAISNFLTWVNPGPSNPGLGDSGKIAGYRIELRVHNETQLVTFRRINPVRDMRMEGARYGMFVTVDMDSMTFTPP